MSTISRLLAVLVLLIQMPMGGVTSNVSTGIIQVGGAALNNQNNGTQSASVSVNTGDLLVALINAGATTQTLSVADSTSDTWTASPQGVLSAPAGLVVSEMYYAVAGTTASRTFSCSASVSTQCSIIVITYRGPAGTLDTSQASGQTSVAAWTSASFSTSNANEVVEICATTTTSPRTVGLIGSQTASYTASSNISGTFRPSCEFTVFSATQSSITGAIGFPSGNANGQMLAIF